MQVWNVLHACMHDHDKWKHYNMIGMFSKIHVEIDIRNTIIIPDCHMQMTLVPSIAIKLLYLAKPCVFFQLQWLHFRNIQVPPHTVIMDNFICSVCYFKGRSIKHLMCHCLLKHKNDGNFIAYCKLQNCMYITTSWNAFKLHCSRKHPNGSIQSTDKNSLLFIDGVSSDDSDYDD